MNHEPSVPDAATLRSGTVRSRRGLIAAGIVTILLIAIFLVWRRSTPSPDRLLRDAHLAFAAGDSSSALQLAQKVIDVQPENTEGLLLAAQSSADLEAMKQAVDYYQRAGQAGGPIAAKAYCSAGELLLSQMKHMSAAEQAFRNALRIDADNREAHRQLAYLLGLSSRSPEAEVHRLQRIQSGDFDGTLLYLLAAGNSAIENPEAIPGFRQAAPDDPLPMLAEARIAMELGDDDRAIELLRTATGTHPQLAAVQVLLGECLLQSGRTEQFDDWLANYPSVTNFDHPEREVLTAKRAEQQGDANAAARSYLNAVQRDPNHQRALYGLGRTLSAAGYENEAEPFLRRTNQLAAYEKAAELAHRVGGVDDYQRVATAAEKLGLLWEAYGWSAVALQQHGSDAPWAVTSVARLRSSLRDLPLIRAAPGSISELAIANAERDLPHITPSPTKGSDESHGTPSEARVTFEDRAAASGLDFQYFNGGDPETRGIVHMFEVVGGGVAVLDYDLNGQPDAYFPQGNSRPLAEDPQWTDRLFHNRAGEQFTDVTIPARIRQTAFGQGATVGDYDADGFPDLYLANIGGNRLLRNNGDGTFDDVTESAGVGDSGYSTSGLMVDLSGDGLPDVYSVKYLAGDDLFTRTCGSDSHPRSCLPQAFEAAADRLYLNLGDGTFTDGTAATGIDRIVPGKGLGIVAFDMAGTGRLSLFIANDVGPNSLLVDESPAGGARPNFVDTGLAAGVALNAVGTYESGMGAAVADVDQDGRLDLFVTNFDDETNTLYQQTADGLFDDRTEAMGLHRKRDGWVGWGTQFVDGELDGRPDLMVTNGHVNDLRDHGKPFRMPLQYFGNRGKEGFVEHTASRLGSCFDTPSLGRGMARLDWNRDNLEDVIISRLDAPAALIANTTLEHGNAFTCRLVGVHSARDAIGTTVIVRCGDRSWTRQLTAGDGNQSSNERRLVFGIGEHEVIDHVRIHRPSGAVEDFHDLSPDTEYLFIEGRAPVVLPR